MESGQRFITWSTVMVNVGRLLLILPCLDGSLRASISAANRKTI